jgi:hypothetical protein
MERAMGIVELTIPYSSFCSHDKVSIMQYLTMQYAWKIHQITKKLSLILMRKHKLSVGMRWIAPPPSPPQGVTNRRSEVTAYSKFAQPSRAANKFTNIFSSVTTLVVHFSTPSDIKF